MGSRCVAMLVTGLWAAVALTSCGGGGAEQANNSTATPAVGSVHSSSMSSENTPILAAGPSPLVTSLASQVTEGTDAESEEPADPEDDDIEAETMFLLTRE